MTQQTPRQDDVKYSRIRDIVVPLFNYSRFHRATSEKEKYQNPHLIERSRLINVFIDLLRTETFAGTYLVAGFRGVGKTSILKQAILKFIQNKHNQAATLTRGQRWRAKIKNTFVTKYIIIDVNLSHKDLSISDILRTMAWSLHDRYSKRRAHHFAHLLKSVMIIAAVSVLLYALLKKLNSIKFFEDWKKIFTLLDSDIFTLFDSNICTLFDRISDYWHILIPAVVLLYAAFDHALRLDLTHQRNIKRLKLLIDRLNSSLRSTDGVQAGGHRYLGFWRKSAEKLYREMNDKEIAYELSEIINDAERKARGRIKSRFIFVIDELDKIESVSLNAADINLPTDQLRRKREKIFEIVGEMKHFFTMTKAKFFFVTGSEMYDAALADVTERDSYLGSIFHHIIYIPSFFTDFNNQSYNITEQTENLLCKFLIEPERIKEENARRQENKEQNKTSIELLNPDRLLLSDYFQLYHAGQAATNELIKHHYILNSYVQFLTMRSKGSPKKVISLIEENLVQSAHIKQGQSLREYYLGNARWEHPGTESYLIFDEIDQYKLGLTSYLYSPFLYSYSSFVANHSDKLILSSAFIWDHLYKYHNAAFSVHHLEYIYELTASSKEPEIKNQLNFLLALMKSRHLREIRSGIFEFKFFSRVSNEIRFLSNVVQSESAVFNFTLDESLSLKRYYNAQLESVKKDFQNDSRNPFIRGFLSRIIGDLHFFDKEYDRAIVYYEDALKYFYRIDYDNFSNGELANMVRWLLLLSLANEKSGHYTKSFSICKDIQREFRKLTKNHKNKNEFREILLYSKIPYAHIIQKLAIVEKTGLNGLNASDLETAYTEIAEIYGGQYTEEKGLDLSAHRNRLIKSEINFKIANILYFRNTLEEHQILRCIQRFTCQDIPYMARLYLQCVVDVIGAAFSDRLNKDITSLTDVLDLDCLERFCNPEGPNYYTALSDYFSKAGNAFITHYAADVSEDTEAPFILDFLENLSCIEIRNASNIPGRLLKNKYFMAARLIYTSAVLSSSINDNANESAQYLKLLYIIRNIVNENITDKGKTEVAKVCHDKLTLILKLTHTNSENFKRLYIQKYKSRLCREKEVEYLAASLKNATPLIKSFPDAPDSIEALILYYEILTKFDNTQFSNNNIQNFLETIDECDIVQSQYVRVMGLYFKTRYHYYRASEKKDNISGNTDKRCYFKWIDELAAKYENANSKKCAFDKNDVKNLSEYSRRAIDSIYCLAEILKLLNIQRNSFIIGYSRTGNFHHRIGWWIIFKRKLDKLIDRAKDDYLELKSLQTELKRDFRLLTYDTSTMMLVKYNLEMAIVHFKKAKETHRRGQPYREALNNMYTMDDDFNDDFAHFQVALERMNVNSRSIDAEIEDCEKLIEIIHKMETPGVAGPRNDWVFDVSKF